MPQENNNKKILAKNTIIVYVQMIVTMAVSLLSVRLVLKALGDSDYGLFNIVGGVIAMFMFMSTSMSVTTTRFLNYERGKKDGDTNRIFNQSNVLHIFFALIILLLLETAGVYYIINFLNVAPGKETDAMFVFQVSTVTACLAVTNVPFQSLFIAHEKFSFVAIIEILNVLLKLCFVLVLWVYEGNALRFYAVSMCMVALFSFVAYHVLATRRWPEIVKWKLVRGWRSYKDQLVFSNWNLLATFSLMLRGQGAALIINHFFGTVVNAAFAVANNVQQQVNTFIGNFDTAVSPQIARNAGAGNTDTSLSLACNTCRMCVLLMEVVFFSLYIELEFVLRCWLGADMPDGTLTFCEYTLFIAVVSSTSAGLVHLINGLGKIKWFKIQGCLWQTLPLIFGWIAYSQGMPPHTIVLFFIISDAMSRITQFWLLHCIYGINVIPFVRNAYTRPFLIFVIMLLYMLLYHQIVIGSFVIHVLGIFITLFVAAGLALMLGLRESERRMLIEFLKTKLIPFSHKP